MAVDKQRRRSILISTAVATAAASSLISTSAETSLVLAPSQLSSVCPPTTFVGGVRSGARLGRIRQRRTHNSRPIATSSSLSNPMPHNHFSQKDTTPPKSLLYAKKGGEAKNDKKNDKETKNNFLNDDKNDPFNQKAEILVTEEQLAEEEERETLLNQSIDSFLRGEYDRPFAEDAAAPHPGLNPGDVVDVSLRSLRDLDDPEPCHGAAVMLRFTAPLSRGERWGGGTSANPWKEVLRGALTPTMLARRIRASQFSGLLDWERLDVTEGLAIPNTRWSDIGVGSTIAFVNAALFFGNGVEPYMIQFTLRKIAGVWLIDDAVINKTEWFVEGDHNGNDEQELE
eukprot:CAMPEP_0185725944 /NCGR_PEP_ID=MMETSP1171-20130828/2071_1 /TAXON_ID=374046 /ORGANISM="Helicotheca tamensis, Strain CCMP826" /LENGTH=341 /DNA_ID=CAMNT_0028394197 /DNA_START=14 /DNA_END=1039 /DNA_ORIENTATION=-